MFTVSNPSLDLIPQTDPLFIIKANRGLAYTEFDEPEILIFYLGKLGRSDNCIMDNLDWFKKKLKDKKDP